MAEVKKRENESLDDMLRRFRKEVEKDKILEDALFGFLRLKLNDYPH